MNKKNWYKMRLKDTSRISTLCPVILFGPVFYNLWMEKLSLFQLSPSSFFFFFKRFLDFWEKFT